MNTQTVHSKHLSKKRGKFILHYRPGTGYIKVIKRDPPTQSPTTNCVSLMRGDG